MPKFSKTTKWTVDTTLTCLTCLSLYLTLSSISEGEIKAWTRPVNVMTTLFMFLLNLMDVKEWYTHRALASVASQQPPQAVATAIIRRPPQSISFWYPAAIGLTESIYLGTALINYFNDEAISKNEEMISIFAVILPYIAKEIRLGLPHKRRDPFEDEDEFRTWLNKRRDTFADPSKPFDMAPGETRRQVIIENADTITREFNRTFNRSY